MLAMPGCPLTSKRSESCELKNSECSRCGRLDPGTISIGDWKLRLKVSGISATNFESIMGPVSVRSVSAAGVSVATGQVSFELARLRAEVHAHRRVDLHFHAFTQDLLESLELGLNGVSAVLEAREM